jgi:ATP-dependent helicase YprA (DUF1998 family)
MNTLLDLTATIHGDKTQQARDFVLKSFRSGRVDVLIATDVAARGIDVKDIGLVINYGKQLQRMVELRGSLWGPCHGCRNGGPRWVKSRD